MDSTQTSVIEIQMRSLRRLTRLPRTVFLIFQNFNDNQVWKSLLTVGLEMINLFPPSYQVWKSLLRVGLEKINQLPTSVASRGLPDLLSGSHMKQWDLVLSKCLETKDVENSPNLKDFCLEMLDRFLKGYPRQEYKSSEFILTTLTILKVLAISHSLVLAPVKKQMERLFKMLEFVFTISWVAENTKMTKKLEKFLEYIQPWVDIAATVPFVFWVDEVDEKLCALLSSFLTKFYPSSPELLQIYLGAIKGIRQPKESPGTEVLLRRNVLWRFSDILVENLVASTDGRFEMVSEGLIFFIALVMDPPRMESNMMDTNLLLSEATSLICSLCLGKLREDTVKGRDMLDDLLEKIRKAKAELRKHFAKISALMWNSVPQTNRKGFFEFLIENLKKKLENEADLYPFEKNEIASVHKELASLRPFLMDVFELQDEYEEIKDIWNRAGIIACLSDHVIDSFLSLDTPIWRNLVYLSQATKHLQLVKAKVAKIRENQSYANKFRSVQIKSNDIVPEQQKDDATTEDNNSVGFEDEEKRIIDQLIEGEAKREIVAIVGMPGQGKTTLARRIFRDSIVQKHFNKCAWCCISQAYDIKRILLDILKGIGEPVPKEEELSVSPEDLANRLRQHLLKGGRYLVVLDDIWDIKPWNELQMSFPNGNHSRILFTSRNQQVAFLAQSCCIVELRPLSHEESWKLLQMEVLEEEEEEEGCRKDLLEIGETIAKNCKGLPLAIALVAGLLKKNKNVESWKQIAESLTSVLADVGCMNILELSYSHLPDFLKPCFLYLGAFPEDEIIDVKLLIQLWIAEGLIQHDGTESLEVIGNGYLINLLGRSLVSVAERSSTYGIKKCRVHDLLRDFCRLKGEEERFLCLQDVQDVSGRYTSLRYEYTYRLCVKGTLIRNSYEGTAMNIRSLLFSLNRSERLLRLVGKYIFLRVLNLGRVRLDSCMVYITELIHLRFLSISCGNYEDIPPTFVNLFRLEVFRARIPESNSYSLINIMRRMPSLRHIMVDAMFQYAERGTKENEEEELLLEPLTNLETFTFFIFSDPEFFEKVARKLPNVRKLGVKLNFCVRLSTYSFSKLESLSLVIKADKISASNLDFPSTLQKLRLRMVDNRLSADMISSIGKLSNLVVLKLEAKFDDKIWDVKDDEFLNLKYLKLCSENLEELTASYESFTYLEQLVFKYCPRLRVVDSRFGEIPDLKRIEVHKCGHRISSSIEEIVDNQRGFGNRTLRCSIAYD